MEETLMNTKKRTDSGLVPARSSSTVMASSPASAHATSGGTPSGQQAAAAIADSMVRGGLQERHAPEWWCRKAVSMSDAGPPKMSSFVRTASQCRQVSSTDAIDV